MNLFYTIGKQCLSQMHSWSNIFILCYFKKNYLINIYTHNDSQLNSSYTANAPAKIYIPNRVIKIN